jgi:hypothetical protein
MNPLSLYRSSGQRFDVKAGASNLHHHINLNTALAEPLKTVTTRKPIREIKLRGPW